MFLTVSLRKPIPDGQWLEVEDQNRVNIKLVQQSRVVMPSRCSGAAWLFCCRRRFAGQIQTGKENKQRQTRLTVLQLLMDWWKQNRSPEAHEIPLPLDGRVHLMMQTRCVWGSDVTADTPERLELNDVMKYKPFAAFSTIKSKDTRFTALLMCLTLQIHLQNFEGIFSQTWQFAKRKCPNPPALQDECSWEGYGLIVIKKIKTFLS